MGTVTEICLVGDPVEPEPHQNVVVLEPIGLGELEPRSPRIVCSNCEAQAAAWLPTVIGF